MVSDAHRHHDVLVLEIAVLRGLELGLRVTVFEFECDFRITNYCQEILKILRVALMADERSHAIRFHLEPNQLVISSQNAEEGEANETIQTDYAGDVTDIGFNAQYLQEFLAVVGDAKVAFEFKDGQSQAQLKPAENGDYEYKYVVMPMRI